MSGTVDGSTSRPELFDELREAHQRLGELKSVVETRDTVIRELRRRLQELEFPFWAQKTQIEGELEQARQHIAELKLKVEAMENEIARVASLEGELAAIHATRVFRYSAGARALYSRLLRLRRG